MSNSIFGFLESENKSLYSLVQEMENLIYKDSHAAILKGRLFAERLSKIIAETEGEDDLLSLTQIERIKMLKVEEIISDAIETSFHNVRMLGNKAAHDEVEEDLESAISIHRNLYKIASWYMENYIDFQFVSDTYKAPKPEVLFEVKQDNDKLDIILEYINKNIENKVEPNIYGSAIEKQTEAAVTKDVIDTTPTIREDKTTTYVKEKEAIQLNTVNVPVNDKKCLIQELSKLKESSKEAVEGLNTFSDFKKYMHVNRNAQDELQEIILSADKHCGAQLVLVCGSVGDGKSHIISYFKNKYPDIMDNRIKLHNDATESLEPDKTSMDTLNDVLDEFCDDKIETSTEKLILAINLGTLNNFIDSEKYGHRFTKLRKYVDSKKILEKSIVENKFEEDSNIQFINFSDYNLYTLKDGRVQSKYIKELINKVTNPSEVNAFYNAYKMHCSSCNNKDKCPIKANYELLSDDNVQNTIVDLLVQCIIKRKIIISTRALLNFMYDLLISRSYIDVNSPMFKDKIGKLKDEEYINSLTPNIIFDHKELSFIFNALNTLDPLNVRNEKVDDFVIKFNNSTEIMEFFEEYIDYPKEYLAKVQDINFDEIEGRRIKPSLIKLFIRSYYLCGKGDLFSLKDSVYENFIKYLYHWNKGDKAKLMSLYGEIKDGILKWNGEADKNQINIFIGQNQVKYKVSEELELKADASNLPTSKESELIKFLTEMEIKYKGNSLEASCGIDIDYALYELLIRVGHGYRPNKKDKNHFIKFIEFINKIEAAGSQSNQLTFTEKNREENRKYRLEFDDEFEIYKFVEI